MKPLFRLATNIIGYGFVEPVHSSVLGIYISQERNMLIAEKFIRSLVDKYGKHTVYTLMVEHGMMKHVRY